MAAAPLYSMPHLSFTTTCLPVSSLMKGFGLTGTVCRQHWFSDQRCRGLPYNEPQQVSTVPEQLAALTAAMITLRDQLCYLPRPNNAVMASRGDFSTALAIAYSCRPVDT